MYLCFVGLQDATFCYFYKKEEEWPSVIWNLSTGTKGVLFTNLLTAILESIWWIHSSTKAQYRKYNSFSRSLNKNKSEIFLPYLVFVIYMTCNGLVCLQNSFKSGVHFSFENSKLGFNTVWKNATVVFWKGIS